MPPIQIKSKRPTEDIGRLALLPANIPASYPTVDQMTLVDHKDIRKDLHRSRSFTELNQTQPQKHSGEGFDSQNKIVIRSNSTNKLEFPQNSEQRPELFRRPERSSFQISRPPMPVSNLFSAPKPVPDSPSPVAVTGVPSYRLSPQIQTLASLSNKDACNYLPPKIHVFDVKPLPSTFATSPLTFQNSDRRLSHQTPVQTEEATLKPRAGQGIDVTVGESPVTRGIGHQDSLDNPIQCLRKSNVQLLIENGKLANKVKSLEKLGGEKDLKISELKQEVERLESLMQELKPQDLAADIEEQLKWQELAREAVERAKKEAEAKKLLEKQCDFLKKQLEHFESIKHLHIEGDSFIKNPFSRQSKDRGSGESDDPRKDMIKPKPVASPNCGSQLLDEDFNGLVQEYGAEDQSQVIMKKTTTVVVMTDHNAAFGNNQGYGSMLMSAAATGNKSLKPKEGSIRDLEDSYYVQLPSHNIQPFNLTTGAHDESTVVKGRIDNESGLGLFDGDRSDLEVRPGHRQGEQQSIIELKMYQMKAEIDRLKSENDQLAEENGDVKRKLFKLTLRQTDSPGNTCPEGKPSINIEARMKFLDITNRTEDNKASPRLEERTPHLGYGEAVDWNTLAHFNQAEDPTDSHRHSPGSGLKRRQTFGLAKSNSELRNPYEDESSKASVLMAEDKERGRAGKSSDKDLFSNQTTKHTPQAETTKYNDFVRMPENLKKDKEILSVQENSKFSVQEKVRGEEKADFSGRTMVPGRKAGNLAGSEGGDIRLAGAGTLKDDSFTNNHSIDSFAHGSHKERIDGLTTERNGHKAGEAHLSFMPLASKAIFSANDDKDSERLMELLNKRDREISELRDRIAFTSSQLDSILMENSRLKESSAIKDAELAKLAQTLKLIEKSRASMREEERKQFIAQIIKFKEERDQYKEMMQQYKADMVRVKYEVARRIGHLEQKSHEKAENYEAEGGEEFDQEEYEGEDEVIFDEEGYEEQMEDEEEYQDERQNWAEMEAKEDW